MTPDLERQLKEYFKDLKFDPEAHKYQIGSIPAACSVSGLISRFHEEFDAIGISNRIAIRDGVDAAALRAVWEETSRLACEQGTAAHLYCEQILQRIPRTPMKSLFEHLKPACTQACLWLLNHPRFRVISIELRGYIKAFDFGTPDKFSILAGSMDLLVLDVVDQRLWVMDWKTNKEIERRSKYGKTMTRFLSRIPDTNYHHYALQMSLYARIVIKALENMGFDNLKKPKCAILHLHAGGFNPEIDFIETPNMELEARRMIESLIP